MDTRLADLVQLAGTVDKSRGRKGAGMAKVKVAEAGLG